MARTRYDVNQTQELATGASQQVLTDVVNAYAALHTSEQIVQFYRGGYTGQAKKSLDISEHAYRMGPPVCSSSSTQEATALTSLVTVRRSPLT